VATFVLELAFDRDNERRLTVRPAHRDYLRALHAEGSLVTAGPWADDSGALLVYDCPDEAAVRQILAADPYFVADAVSIRSLRQWTPIIPA